MAVKQWYLIEIECIKFNPSFNMKVGEKQIVAKVKSKGLAFVTANAIAKLYDGQCYVTIK